MSAKLFYILSHESILGGGEDKKNYRVGHKGILKLSNIRCLDFISRLNSHRSLDWTECRTELYRISEHIIVSDNFTGSIRRSNKIPLKPQLCAFDPK